MKKPNVAVVGCGYWGKNLIRNFNDLSTANLYACCDEDTKKLDHFKTLYPYIKTEQKLETILKDEKVDAVVIATPVASHYPLAMKALKAGKHTFVEKPLTDNSKKAQKLIDIANEKDLTLMVDHTFEYMPAINKMEEIARSGELGDIRYIHANWLNLGLLQPDVNVTWDLATHVISIMNKIFDKEPQSVLADGAAYVRDEIEEVANISVKYENNSRGYLTISWLEPCKVRRMTVVGSKKMMVFDLLNNAEQVKIYDTGVDLIKEGEKARASYRAGEIFSPYIESSEPLRNSCAHFIECIQTGETPITNGEVGLGVVKILEGAQKSLDRGGKEVKL